ncbi:MAG: DUF424 family protein [archaeon]
MTDQPFTIKLHRREGREVLAVCDTDILGKIFEEGNRVLDLTSPFYTGNQASTEELKGLMASAHILNLVGEGSIKVASDMGLIEDDNVIRVDGIPHAQAINNTQFTD